MPPDPFITPDTFPARFAARLGSTEGQLYSMLLGILLVWVISANGLPTVVWEPRPPARAASTAAEEVLPRRPPARTAWEDVAAGPLELPAVEPSMPPPTRDRLDVPVAAAGPSPAPDGEAVSPPADEASTPAPAPARPTEVVSGGYASADAGTPLATIGVPEGSVAVARRAGQPSKVAYLRLSGTSTPLVLDVDPDAANLLDAQAVLWLCPVLDEDWEVGPGDTSLDDAPTYDCDRPIVGSRSTTNDQWTFDIADVQLAEDAGVALVPGPDATAPEFQVVFRLRADADPATEERR